MIAFSLGNDAKITYDCAFWLHDKRFFFRTMKDALFKVAFQGAFGKFWGALMSIPQVRYMQQHLNHHC